MRKSKFYKHNGEHCIYEYDYPGIKDFLDIFPEVKELVKVKRTELLQEREKILKEEVRPFMERISFLKDEFSRIFWREAYITCFTNNLKKINEELKKLSLYQKFFTSDNSWEEKFLQAKERRILDLYPFKRLRRIGNRYLALCPFHEEKTGSFWVFPENRFHCFGCGADGDAIDFVSKINNISIKEAVCVGG